jgi:hypothetical protein
VPLETLAGRTTQIKLPAAKRDFEQVAGLAAGSARSDTLIEAAEQFASVASETNQNLPHTAGEWSEVVGLWEQASNQLKQVPVEDMGYVKAQKLQAQYQKNLGIVRTHLQAEQAFVEALERAKDKIEIILATPADTSPDQQNQVKSQLQGIINQLENVKSGTTANPRAQQLLQLAQNKLEQLQPK